MNNIQKRINLKFNVPQLDRTIVALINNGFNKKFASNVSTLFNLISDIKDYEKETRIYLIKKISNIILKNNIIEKDSILSFIDIEGKYKNEATEILNELFEAEIQEEELLLLDKTISNQLRYKGLEENSSDLIDELTNLKSENYDNFENQIKKISSIIESTGKTLRDAKESIESSKKKINLSNNSFLKTLKNIIEKEKNPGNKIKSGIQALNEMMNGGFEKGRLYIALAVAKGWKSGFLLKMARDTKKYNSFLLKNPTKKPVILYVNMENTNEETISRIWVACFGNNSRMSDYNEEIAARMLEEAGIFTPNEPTSPEIIIEYRPNKSISTNDLVGMIEDLEKEGKECVCLILDYLKRIRSISPNKEIRLELSQITDELATIAKEYDIPVITASQLNREAFRAIDDATTFEGKAAAAERMGASNVGESIDLIQNCDVAFILNRLQNITTNEKGEIEYDDRFLSVKIIASRTKQPKFISFKHRFKDGNDMDLIDDIHLQNPLSVIGGRELIKDSLSRNGQRTYGKRKIGD